VVVVTLAVALAVGLSAWAVVGFNKPAPAKVK
jgi:hypothetical protein